jgi:uncharacterized repeat protein (TIGR03803 family)
MQTNAIRINCTLVASMVMGAVMAASPVPAAEKVLYSFPDLNAGQPTGPLLMQGDALFGTGTGSIQYCCGEIFELSHAGGGWQEQTLATFDNTSGSLPYGGLIADANGVLYGTTAYGGTNRAGIVFSLTNSGGAWSLQPIWQFGGKGDGRDPFGPVVMDASGTIYGATFYGGQYDRGTIFSLVPQNGTWTESVLYSFCHGTTCGGRRDGHYPVDGLLLDAKGTIYGVTTQGGTADQGAVFALSQSGGVWTEKVIWSFGGNGDGVSPMSTLIEDKTGALYGTTYYGGTAGQGTVFRLVRSGKTWSESVLWQFTGGKDGGFPDSRLTLGSDGTLYGTASAGGTGQGVIFSLSQSGGQWTEKTVHTFDGTDGAQPQSALIADRHGQLYGATMYGGSNAAGTVFQMTLKP